MGDANLMKCPIVCMTGHDPALTRSRNLMGRQYGGGKLDSRFSDTEASNLRKYLVERGGVLTFDDCGVNAPAQAMIRLFLAQRWTKERQRKIRQTKMKKEKKRKKKKNVK